MKSQRWIILFLSTLSACMQAQEYIEETCSGYQKIHKTANLHLQDSLPGFEGISNSGKHFQSRKLEGRFTMVFLKRNAASKNYITLLNEELQDRAIGKLAKAKNGNIIASDDLKLAHIFGVKMLPGKLIESSHLFLANEDAIVTAMYKNVCEKDIVKIIEDIE
jgi:hypothetical protein